MKTSLVNPADWFAAVDAAAAKSGQSRNEWLYHAAIAKLPASVAKKLTARPPAHRPKAEAKR